MQVHNERTVYITLVAFTLHPSTVGPARRSPNGTCFVLHFRSLGSKLTSLPLPRSRHLYYHSLRFMWSK